MNTKYVAGAAVLAAVIAGGSFWGGMTYAKSNSQTGFKGAQGAQFFSAGGAGRTFRTGGVTAGTVIAKDATSITVKSQDGSTKIILLGSATQVMKTSTGGLDDLSVGENVAVTGSPNSDGSISAQTVSLRPAETTQPTAGTTR